jgi:hypothetical protein
MTPFRPSFRPNLASAPRRDTRPGAVTADEILAAVRKANGEPDPDDDDPKSAKDDDPEVSSPDQGRLVATAPMILAAMRKAMNER